VIAYASVTGNWLNVAFRLPRENVKLDVGRGNTPRGKCAILKVFPGTVTSMNARGEKICRVG
jgi:hypothetical protein